MGLLDTIKDKYSSMDDYQKKNTILGLAQGFAGMTANPNAGQIIAGIQNQRQGLMQNRLASEKQKKSDVRKSAAVNLLKIKHPDLAQLVENNILSPEDAISESRKPKAERKTAADVTGRLRYLDDGTTVFDLEDKDPNAVDKDQFAQINVLRDDLGKELSEFKVIDQGYKNIQTFFKDPNQVTDYAMAVAFAKVLDPGSVAREGEVSAINNAGAKIPAFRAAFANAVKGTGKMDAKMRYDIAKAATELYKNSYNSAISTVNKFESLAEKSGLNPQDIYMGGDLASPAPIAPWSKPAELTQLTQEGWEALPYSRKNEYMQALKG